MNFGGMGTLEVLFVLLIAFIFLGPQRMSDAAKTLGKFVRQLRQMTADLPDLVLDEDDKSTRPPASSRRNRRATPQKNPTEDKGPEEKQEVETAVQDSPVASKPGSAAQPEDTGDTSSSEERQ